MGAVARHRLAWMERMLERENRIALAQGQQRVVLVAALHRRGGARGRGRERAAEAIRDLRTRGFAPDDLGAVRPVRQSERQCRRPHGDELPAEAQREHEEDPEHQDQRGRAAEELDREPQQPGVAAGQRVVLLWDGLSAHWSSVLFDSPCSRGAQPGSWKALSSTMAFSKARCVRI